MLYYCRFNLVNAREKAGRVNGRLGELLGKA
jgi:hypothetical protein